MAAGQEGTNSSNWQWPDMSNPMQSTGVTGAASLIHSDVDGQVYDNSQAFLNDMQKITNMGYLFVALFIAFVLATFFLY